jgi:hypothetical protein
MNKVITAAVILCLAGAAQAGDARTSHGRSTGLAGSGHSILLGVDVDAALPLSSLYSDANGPGASALLTVEYPIMEQLSMTGRVGFQFHLNKDLGAGADSHVHSIPVLLGAKYYVMETNRQGLFAAAELGIFDLMLGQNQGTASNSDNQVKMGAGIGAGYSWNQWNFRVNIHSHDVGNFGDYFVVSGGAGYQFAGF